MIDYSPSQTYENLIKSERMSTQFFHYFTLFLTEKIKRFDTTLLTNKEIILFEKNIATSLSLMWDLHHLLLCNHSEHLLIRNFTPHTTLSNKDIKNSAKRSFQKFQHITHSFSFIESEYQNQCELALEKILSFYLSNDQFINVTNTQPVPKPWRP